MKRRFASAAWLAAADRLAAAFLAIFVAAGTLVKVASGPTPLAIALAALGVLGAVVTFLLKALHERAKRAELSALAYARLPLRVNEAAAQDVFYEIGVDLE